MARKGPVTKRKNASGTKGISGGGDGYDGGDDYGMAQAHAPHELGAVLRRLVDQIEDAERSNQETLQNMQSRLDELYEQAEQVSSKQKNVQSDALQRLKGQISHLSDRIEIVSQGRAINEKCVKLDQRIAELSKQIPDDTSYSEADPSSGTGSDLTTVTPDGQVAKQAANLNKDRLASLAEHFSPVTTKTPKVSGQDKGDPTHRSLLQRARSVKQLAVSTAQEITSSPTGSLQARPAKDQDLEKRFALIAVKLEETLDRRMSEMDERLEISNKFDDLTSKLDEILRLKSKPAQLAVLEEKMDSLTSYIQKAERTSSRIAAIEVQLEKLLELVEHAHQRDIITQQQIEKSVEKVFERKATQLTHTISKVFEDNLTIAGSLDRLEAIEQAILHLNSERSHRDKRTTKQLLNVERGLQDLSARFSQFEQKTEKQIENLAQPLDRQLIQPADDSPLITLQGTVFPDLTLENQKTNNQTDLDISQRSSAQDHALSRHYGIENKDVSFSQTVARGEQSEKKSEQNTLRMAEDYLVNSDYAELEVEQNISFAEKLPHEEFRTEENLKNYVADFTAQLQKDTVKVINTDAQLANNNTYSQEISRDELPVTLQENQLKESALQESHKQDLQKGGEDAVPYKNHENSPELNFTETALHATHLTESHSDVSATIDTLEEKNEIPSEFNLSSDINVTDEPVLLNEEISDEHLSFENTQNNILSESDGEHDEEQNQSVSEDQDQSHLFVRDMQNYRAQSKDDDDFLNAARQAAQSVTQRHKLNKSLSSEDLHDDERDYYNTHDQNDDYDDKHRASVYHNNYDRAGYGRAGHDRSGYALKGYDRGRDRIAREQALKQKLSSSSRPGSKALLIIVSISALALSAAILINELKGRDDKTSLIGQNKNRDFGETQRSGSEEQSFNTSGQSGRESGKRVQDRVSGQGTQVTSSEIGAQLRTSNTDQSADQFAAEAQVRASNSGREQESTETQGSQTQSENLLQKPQSTTGSYAEHGGSIQIEGQIKPEVPVISTDISNHDKGITRSSDMESLLADKTGGRKNQNDADQSQQNISALSQSEPTEENRTKGLNNQNANARLLQDGSQDAAALINIKKSDEPLDIKEGINNQVNQTPEGIQQPLPPVQVGPYSLRLAAAQGNPKAQFVVAMRFAEGKGIGKDYKSAAEWLMRSAAQSYAPAQYHLAALHERGQGIEKDIEKAKLWYKRAANNGNLKAMHNLGVLYTNLPDNKADYAGAIKWFQQAANHGLADSQYNLGILYKNGLGVEKNLIEAYKWFALAGDRGDVQSSNQRDQMRETMSSQDIFTAEQAVARWRVVPVNTGSNVVDQQDSQWTPVSNNTSNTTNKTITADPQILQTQILLHRLGYDIGPADGQENAKIREAIQDFQKKNGLKPTGVISPDLIEKMKAKSG